MVSGDDGDAAHGADFFEEPSEGDIDGFDGDDGRVEVACMPDHVAVGIVDADEVIVVLVEFVDDSIGDFSGFHPGTLREFDAIALDLDVFLEFFVEVAGAVAVPEVGDMAEFLSFGGSERAQARGAEVFAHGAVDCGRCDEIVRGDVCIAVVFHHAGIADIRSADAVELGEVVGIESA